MKPTYFNLVVVGAEKQEYSLNGDNGASTRRFYTNLDFSIDNIKINNNDNVDKDNGEVPLSDDDYSIFAKYFIDMIRRERG